MSVRTIEELSDFLADELAWRKKELADLRTLAENKDFKESRRNALVRCGVIMLYAHWEGFIRASSSAYLEFVSRQRLLFRELAPNFVAVGIRQLLHNVSMSKTSRDHNTLVKFFLTRMSERSSLPYKSVVDTGSNLSSTVFRDVVERLGLDYSLDETKEKLIDEKLLNSRNTIAHGSYLQTDLNGFVDMQDEVLGMMELFRNQIENSAIMKSYRL
jgi:MAE_28990/MAE_18760-like HEPN